MCFIKRLNRLSVIFFRIFHKLFFCNSKFFNSSLYCNQPVIKHFYKHLYFFMVCYLAGLFPGVSRWLPTGLMSAQAFAAGTGEASQFARAAAVAGISGAAGYVVAVLGFSRKMI